MIIKLRNISLSGDSYQLKLLNGHILDSSGISVHVIVVTVMVVWL